jgi:FMN phosphatase YigB (HAD superfamily)
LGLAKPDVDVFEALLQELAAPPKSVLFIDDRIENTQAPASLGIHAAKFTSAKGLSSQLGNWESETRSSQFN